MLTHPAGPEPGRQSGGILGAPEGVSPGQWERSPQAALDRRRVDHPPPLAKYQRNGVGTGEIDEKDAARQRKRSDRKKLRNVAGKLLPDERVSRCGRHLSRAIELGDVRYAEIRKWEGRAHWSGVVSCVSVWHCPDCAAKISRKRQKEMTDLVAAHQETGGTVALVTLTLPHTTYDRAATLRKDVPGLWAKVARGAPWKRAMQKGRVVGGPRSLEITHGRNGWHPHLHILVFFDAGGDAATFLEWLIDRWIATAERAGYQCSREAQDWRMADTPGAAGEYVTKWGVEWEITHAHMKDGKGGSRAPFQILADFETHGLQRDADLFREYARAFKGARQLTWFGDVRARYGHDDQSDEEVLAEEDAAAETVCYIDQVTFSMVHYRGLEAALFEAAEEGGLLGVIRFAAMHHLGVAGVKPPEFGRRLRTYGDKALRYG
jgi:hypothetical protein